MCLRPIDRGTRIGLTDQRVYERGRVMGIVRKLTALVAIVCAAVPLPGVVAGEVVPPLPGFPSEGVDQPEHADIRMLVASPDGTVVFAAGASASTTLPVLYRSTDGGHSWQKAGDDSLESAQRHRSFLGGTLLVSPAFATDRRVFALNDRGLQRSDDGGHLFTPVSPTRGVAAV